MPEFAILVSQRRRRKENKRKQERKEKERSQGNFSKFGINSELSIFVLLRGGVEFSIGLLILLRKSDFFFFGACNWMIQLGFSCKY